MPLIPKSQKGRRESSKDKNNNQENPPSQSPNKDLLISHNRRRSRRLMKEKSSLFDGHDSNSDKLWSLSNIRKRRKVARKRRTDRGEPVEACSVSPCPLDSLNSDLSDSSERHFPHHSSPPFAPPSILPQLTRRNTTDPNRTVKVKYENRRLGLWNKEERTALWEGLMLYPPKPKSERTRGVKGCWSHIKEDSRFKDALKMRTTTQMKDKARGWIRTGVLSRELEARKNDDVSDEEHLNQDKRT